MVVVPVMALWLPILVSAILVFVASSVIHMMTPLHKGDYKKVPNEDGAMEALRKFNIPPGDYMFPLADSHKAMKDPAFMEKWNKGPVGLLTVMESGPPNMGKSLGLWFLYCVVVGAFAAYVTGHALSAHAPYRGVFRFAGITAFACYSVALWQNTIWYKRDLMTTLKSNIDGLVYAALTAGTFGWLWPK